VSDYGVGAPPPRRNRPATEAGTSGKVSPLIAAGREVAPPPEFTPDEPEERLGTVETAPSPLVWSDASTGDAALPVVGEVLSSDATKQLAPVVVEASSFPSAALAAGGVAPVVHAADELETPLRKKTIAFPADLWRYAGTVHNATAEFEDELYFQEFVWSAIRREIDRREAEYNGGRQFLAPSRLRRGRRISED